MARVTINHTNFTAGEVSPKCYGRVDVARYQNGAKSLRNCIVNIHGGAQRRSGKVFVAGTKDHSKRSRLVPFVFSVTQAYMLEFGHLYMRVYVQSGGQVVNGSVPYEITTPYTEAMLPDLDYTQGADTMFIFHGSVPIYTLKRFASDNWSMAPAPISVTPFDELGHRFEAILFVDSPNVGVGRTFTADSAFNTGDIGRHIRHMAGDAVITAVNSGSQVTANILSAFPANSVSSNEWVLDGSPRGQLIPSAKSPVGATINLNFDSSLELETAKAISAISHDGASTASAQVIGHGYSTGNNVVISGCSPAGYNGTFGVTVIDADNFSYPLNTDPGASTALGTAARQIIVAPAAGWRSQDVGKFVRINGGLVQVTQVLSQIQAIGVIKQELTAVVGAPADAWTLESSVWNAQNGYPRTGALYEQRLVVGGSNTYPLNVWGSRSGLYFDFTLGTIDDDAFSFSLPSTEQHNPITKLMSSAALLPLTYGGEYTMIGGVEKPLTPTNIQAKPRSAYGCNKVKPVRAGKEIMYVQRAGRKVRALAYETDTGQYASPDLTVLAEHITTSGIVDMAYQQEPGSLLWCVRADGKMATLTLDRDEGVTAWTPQDTDGFYESVASIPNATGDEVWVIVRRVINGNTVRYVERFDAAYYTDCGIKGSDAVGKEIWAGLNHLEGKSVVARADDVYIGAFTVAGGQIVLPRNAKQVEIGLPFTSQVTLLKPEVQAGDGTAQGNAQRVHEVSLLLMETVSAKMNGEPIAFRQFGEDVLDTPIAPASGFERIGLTDWTRGEQEITITQDEPNPFHLLGVIRKFTVNS